MLTHSELKRQALANPETRDAYNALEDEYLFVHELLHAREQAGLTQAEVAEKMHTKAPAIARIEAGGKHSPSISTLRKYANAVGCNLEIRLTPKMAN